MMKRRQGRATWFVVGLAGLAIASWTSGIQAQEGLAASEAADFIGEWELELRSAEGSFGADLSIKDVEGKVVAEMKPEFGGESGPISDIEKSKSTLIIKYTAEFGGTERNIRIELLPAGERIEGKMLDEGGEFSLDVRGSKKTGTSTRRRFRRGPATSKLTLAGEEVRVMFAEPTTEHADYARMKEVKDGQVVSFMESFATKFRTPIDLKFGDAVIKTGNVAEDYPGVYSLWLKKSGTGWKLVFNWQADVWGSMHDAEADVAEVPLQYAQAAEPNEKYNVELVEAEGGALLKIAWGDSVWSTSFKVAP